MQIPGAAAPGICFCFVEVAPVAQSIDSLPCHHPRKRMIQ
jgi:hypothetical protein